MNALVAIYFNDTLIAYTDKTITYERENDSQKEYHFTHTKSLLSASLFCEEIDIIQNENIVVEIL